MPSSAVAAPPRALNPVIVFAPGLVLSAFLIVQLPMVLAKFASPSLGGGGAWTVALAAVHAGVLLGYLYERALAARKNPNLSLAIDLPFIAVALLAAPAVTASIWPAAATGAPTLPSIVLYTAALALPVAIVAAVFQTLRRRLIETDPTVARGTTVGFGGLGVILALAVHPVAIEPLLSLAQQAWIWTALYLFLTGAVAGWRPPVRDKIKNVGAAAKESGHGGWRERIHWMALAFVPAGLLVCATARIMSEFAAASLFWAVPVAIYVASLAAGFVPIDGLRERWVRAMHVPLLLVAAIFSTFTPVRFAVPAVLLTLAVLLLTALDCHGHLARRRPAYHRRHEFMSCLLIGAMLGSAFAALLAPALFDFPVEYAILLVLAGLLRRPTDKSEETANARYQLATSNVIREISAPAAGLGILVLFSPRLGEGGAAAAALLGIVVLFLLVFALLSSGRPIRFGLCVGVLALFGAEMAASQTSASVHRARSMLGAYQVKQVGANGYLLFFREHDLQGVQHLAASRRRERHTYYHAESGVGRLFAALERSSAPANVGVIGLGAGELACYKQPHQHWTFFEHDPEVARVSGSGRLFQFVQQCAPDARIVIGPAAAMIGQERQARYDLLIVDAATFASFPTHLLTRKALALYLERLRPGGLILFHVSSRQFDLEPALAALAEDAGLAARLLEARPPANAVVGPFRKRSTWVVMARESEALLAVVDGFEARPGGWGAWRPLRVRPGYRAWTDDYADLVGLLR